MKTEVYWISQYKYNEDWKDLRKFSNETKLKRWWDAIYPEHRKFWRVLRYEAKGKVVKL